MLGLALLLGGCNQQDADCLARVGQKAFARVQALAGNAGSPLTPGWQAMWTDLDGMTLDARVSARLRWDKALAGAQIQVTIQGRQVELKGKVADQAQRQRAGELAESTVGVEGVTNALESSP